MIKDKKQSIPNQTIGWLRFVFLEKSSSGKTEIWTVYHKDTKHELAEIKWNGAWRQYWAEYVNVGMTRGCMRDCSDFIDKLMKARKNGRR